jgi:hypothetical protein
MNIIKHTTVLKALEQRANRFRKKGKMVEAVARAHAWSLDETGTISMGTLNHREILQQEQIEIKGVSEEVLRVHGVLPGRREEGITRLIYENANGLSNRLGGNAKLNKAKDLIDKLEADVVLYNEHRQNLMHSDNRNGWNQLSRGGEAEVRSIVAHNVHKGCQVGRLQEGGTGILMFGQLTEYLDMPNSGKDESGLGRWTMTVVKGDGVQTRIICGYNPCGNKRTDSSTSYQQHQGYLIQQKRDAVTCPRTKFRDDLISLLTTWREAGDRIVVCLMPMRIYTQIPLGRRSQRRRDLG